MSPTLRLLERKMLRQEAKAPEKAPAPTGDLGQMIEAMIEQQVEKRVKEALLEQQRQFVKPVPAPATPPPVRKPRPPFTSVWHRDGNGQLLWAETTIEGKDEKDIIEVLSRDEFGGIATTRTFTLAKGEIYKPGGKRKSPVLPDDYKPRMH